MPLQHAVSARSACSLEERPFGNGRRGHVHCVAGYGPWAPYKFSHQHDPGSSGTRQQANILTTAITCNRPRRSSHTAGNNMSSCACFNAVLAPESPFAYLHPELAQPVHMQPGWIPNPQRNPTRPCLNSRPALLRALTFGVTKKAVPVYTTPAHTTEALAHTGTISCRSSVACLPSTRSHLLERRDGTPLQHLKVALLCAKSPTCRPTLQHLCCSTACVHPAPRHLNLPPVKPNRAGTWLLQAPSCQLPPPCRSFLHLLPRR